MSLERIPYFYRKIISIWPSARFDEPQDWAKVHGVCLGIVYSLVYTSSLSDPKLDALADDLLFLAMHATYRQLQPEETENGKTA